MRTRFLILLTFAGMAASAGSFAQVAFSDEAKGVERAESIAPATDFALIDLDGTTRDLRQNDRACVRAFVFLSTECPIANSYTPALNRLFAATGGGDDRVEIYGVLSDRTVKRDAAAKHFREYRAEFPILFDATGQLAEALAPTHVPEAFVVDAKGTLIYRGAIDDVWGEVGRRKPEATETWLADAVAAAVWGDAVAVGRTTPVGCPFETLPEDATGQLAEALAPTHVPEAFVVDAKGTLIYRGAIDDVWGEVGRRKPEATETWLADAVAAAVWGDAVAVGRTTPVGCPFETLPEDATGEVTYCRDVAPILLTRCVGCHREGQVAPFALETYEQAAKRAEFLVSVTQDRIMPPWIPAGSHGKFVGDRRLTDREISILKRWAAGGSVRGDEADLPPAPKFAQGWRLGEPDLVLEMPESFDVPADGADVLQNFVIPIEGLEEDKLVAAIEFVPGNPRVVHHSLLFLDMSGAARKLDAATPEPGYGRFGGPGFAPSGGLGGWSPGNTPRRLPNEMGRHLRKGSDLVMQIHYHPTGKPESDRSRVGIYFTERPAAELMQEPERLVGTIWASDYGLDIPAGEDDYRRETSYTLPRDVVMVGVVPHMHLLGKSMKATAILPSGEKLTIIDVDRWVYDWQDEYYFERPFALPKGTVLHVAASFDNSSSNPSNPTSPPRRVTWGDETDDEMMFCFFLITTREPPQLIQTIVDNLVHDRLSKREAKLERGAR